MNARFKLGQLVTTRGFLARHGDDVDLVATLIARHAAGDWGDLGDEDKRANEIALEYGYRILSAYDTPKGKVWVITEADRSATTVLLPEEY